MTECMPQVKKTGHIEKIQDMLKKFVHAQTNRVHHEKELLFSLSVRVTILSIENSFVITFHLTSIHSINL